MSKKVPSGRTLSTYDKYLPGYKTGSPKERPVVVLDLDKMLEIGLSLLIVFQLSATRTATSR